MPIKGWKNPYNGRLYPLDDPKGMAVVAPEEVLREIVANETADARHSGTSLTVTCGMSCPRKTIIMRFLDCWPDPQKMWAVTAGRYIHAALAAAGALYTQEWITEHNGGKEMCEFEGVVGGMRLSGRVDAYKRDYTVLKDYKTSLSGADKWVAVDRRAKPEAEAQLNINRMLVEQVVGKPCFREHGGMQVWVMGTTMQVTYATVLSEPQVMATPVGDTDTAKSGWKVGDLYKQHVDAFDKISKGEAPQSVAAAMPMVGLTMYQSKRGGCMCVNNCPVKRECDQLVLGGL